MKKIISKILSASVCAAMIMSTAISAAAETISVDPDYPIHGNKCGIVYIQPEVDRDISVNITQITPDGDFTYYDAIIPAAGNAVGENDYSFILEGKNDSSYQIVISVSKYKLSTESNPYTYKFTIKDTDFLVDEVVESYTYTFTVIGSNEFSKPSVIESSDPLKNNNNVVEASKTIAFPVSDYLQGDVTLDGEVDLYDVIAVAKYLLDPNYLTSEQLSIADYNSDDVVDLFDAIDIAKAILNK